MTDSPPPDEASDRSGDVQILNVHGRRLVLVGTAHISRESVDLVREVIESERPDCVCIELDAQRFEALSNESQWKSLDLRDIIRTRQLAHLIVNLMLSSYQRRIGLQLGVKPGSELLEAARVAEACGIPVALCDRDVRVTLRRAWTALSAWKKFLLLGTFMGTLFDTPELSEEELRRIRKQDVITEMMREMGEAMPALKRVLIDERDSYLAEKIRQTSGERIVAVVGAGHVHGMIKALETDTPCDMDEIESVPPVSSFWKWLGWAIPLLIIGSVGYIGLTRGGAAAGENALYWFIANAVPTGIGAVLAASHPLTIVAAALSAPFTSLTPLIGAGYVAAFVQAWARPPTVSDMEKVGDDFSSPKRWWSSRLLRIFLVFFLTTLGSVIGTWVGGIEIARNLF